MRLHPATLSHSTAFRPTAAVERLPRTQIGRSPPTGSPLKLSGAGAAALAIALLTALAVLLLLEFLVFETPWLVSRMPITGSEPTDKLLLASRYTDTKVLMLGDSRMRAGFHPLIIQKACGCGPGFNAGFGSSDPRLLQIMADRLLRKLSPQLVVISVSQWELSDGAQIGVSESARQFVPFWDLPRFEVDPLTFEEARDTLTASWRLYRYRSALRIALDPSSGVEHRDDLRRGFRPFTREFHLDREAVRRTQHDRFDSFSVKGDRATALRTLVSGLRGRGLQVLLVAPPLYPDLHRRVPAELEAYQAAMTQLARETGAGFVDLTDGKRIGVESEHFRDVVHLNQDGAMRMSRYVGKLIRAYFGRSLNALQ